MDLIITLIQYQVSMAKQKFKLTNWPIYNNALRQRGSLTVWLDEVAVTLPRLLFSQSASQDSQYQH